MKSGFIAVIGRPNVGKSSLVNAILGTKLSIVTNKSQTTRNNIKGIYTKDDVQIVFLDTPGIHEPHKKLNESLNSMAYASLKDADGVILVIDANTGQNGLQQAKVFKECVNLTAVALTKLDGSAKGAIVLAIAKDLSLPVKLVGVGEQIQDLKDFDSKEFINALFK